MTLQAQTLATARSEIAKRAAEVVLGTATGGSTTTLIDVNNLQYVDSYWNEQYVLFTSGANNGLTRKVSAFTSASSQATLYSSVTAVASGDTYELYRRFSPTDYKTALNAAINKSWPSFFEKVSAVVTATQDTLQYDFPNISPGTQTPPRDGSLIGIDYQRWTQPCVSGLLSGIAVPGQPGFPYQRLSPDDYEVIERWDAINRLTVKAIQLRFNPDTNRLIRFVYGAPLSTVVTETDRLRITEPEIEWVYAKTIEELWRIEASRSEAVARKDALQEHAHFAAEAEKLRKDLGHIWPPKPLRRTRFYLGGVV